MEAGTSHLASKEGNEESVADFEVVTKREEPKAPFLKHAEVSETIALEEQDASRLKGFDEMDIEENLLVAPCQQHPNAKICLCVGRND